MPPARMRVIFIFCIAGVSVSLGLVDVVERQPAGEQGARRPWGLSSRLDWVTVVGSGSATRQCGEHGKDLDSGHQWLGGNGPVEVLVLGRYGA